MLAEAKEALASLERIAGICAETLADPGASESSKATARMALISLNDTLKRLNHVLGAKDAAEMRRRYEEYGSRL
jgi:hypothetical protein